MFENPGFPPRREDEGHSESVDAQALPRIDSRRLLAGGRELVIEHAGQHYRLRLTRNDKLILTK